MKTIITTILFFGILANQGAFEANLSKSEFLVKGTSTVHDWHSVVNDYSVAGVMSESEVSNLKVVVTATSIKSGKSMMDDKTYDALKANKFPTIEFTAAKLTRANGKISGTGNLSLAGESKSISFTADTKTIAEGTQVTGIVPIKMSEFGIDPPTAMFGTITTGDEITIEFKFLLN